MTIKTNKKPQQRHMIFAPAVNDGLDEYNRRYLFGKKRTTTSTVQQAVVEFLEKNGITIKKD